MKPALISRENLLYGISGYTWETPTSSRKRNRMSLLGEVQKAHEFFRQHDWIQGQYVTYTKEDGEFKLTGHCLLGCLIYGYGKMFVLIPLLLEALEKLGYPVHSMDGWNSGTIVDWNDTEGRTKEEVDDLWRVALELAKEKDQENERARSAESGGDDSQDSRMVPVHGGND